MKLTFNTIDITNFLSFKHVQFNYNMLEGMTLIMGKNNDIPGSKNGCGKSNLFSALVYALFGELPNKVNRANIPNRSFSDLEPMEIVLDFCVSKTQYRITRGLTKKYRTAFCKLERLDVGENESAWIDLTKSSLLLTQKFINEEVLKTDISLFLRSMLLSADQTYNFFKLNAGQKKEFIENLFGLDFYNNLYTLIHQDVLAFDKDLNIKEHNLITSTHLLNDLTSSSEDWEKNHNQTIANIKKVLADKVSSYKSLESNIASQKTSLVELSEKKTKVKDIKDKLEKKNQDLLKQNNKLLISINKLTSSVTNRQEILNNHNKICDALCEDCKKIYLDLSDYSNLISLNEKELAFIDKSKEKLQVNLDNIQQVSEKINQITTTELDINEKIELIKSNTAELLVQFNTTKASILQYKEQLNNLSENPYKSFIDKAKADIDTINNSINEITTNQSYLKAAENIVSQDTIKRFIVRDMLSLLNTRIAYYLSKVGARYTCEFDENMNYTFITETGTTDYNNFSSGERTRLAIAASFAFRDFMATRSGISSNVLILDEYMDSNLDSIAIEGLLSILKEFLALYGQRIFVVSHRSEVDSSMFNNFILVEKTNGISTLTITQAES